jgi:hypothetical protein
MQYLLPRVKKYYGSTWIWKLRMGGREKESG